uniref:Uncharacterized protein n=1 Tax=Saimiri boliviensis boliviensis TaxID=39432 RepID=A0A2K6U971_SAIBB
MARRHCFSYWLLVCWLVVTVAEANHSTLNYSTVHFYLQQYINLHMDKKRYLLPVETQKIMQTIPTARSLHSPLHLSRGSIFGFQTDLSSLQGVTTVFHSSHFIGHTVALLPVGISSEEDSKEEAHLRKSEREEKPKHTEGKKKKRKSQSFRKSNKKISVLSFQT